MTVSLQYLAGIIDGEGCIMLVRTGKSMMEGLYTSWTPKVMIANTNMKLLVTLQAEFGGVIKRVVKQGENSKQGFRLEWHGMKAAEIAADVVPYLIVKDQQAGIAIEAITFRNAQGGKGKKKSLEAVLYLNDCADRIKHLNKRGLN